MDKLIKATELKVGDVMIGFLDRTAEVIEVNTTGRQFVYFKVEGLPRDRVDKYAEIWIRVPDVVDEAAIIWIDTDGRFKLLRYNKKAEADEAARQTSECGLPCAVLSREDLLKGNA
jgi:hypothetical protein